MYIPQTKKELQSKNIQKLQQSILHKDKSDRTAKAARSVTLAEKSIIRILPYRLISLYNNIIPLNIDIIKCLFLF